MSRLFETLIEEIVAGILIGLCAYLLLVPFVHEASHALVAHLSGWEVVSFQVSIPALVTPSYVSIIAPLGADLTFFYMAGSLGTLFWGFIVSLIPIVVKGLHWLFLSIGFGLMSDALIYPIYSNISKIGDWYLVDPVLNVFTIGLFLIMLILSIRLNRLMSYRRRRRKIF
jgi:hypothetical protein